MCCHVPQPGSVASRIMTQVTFANLWIDGRWQTDVTVSIDAAGYVASIGAEPMTAEATLDYIPGLTLPGIASAHCHAFQRLLPGWTQRARSRSESFWTWREAMYAVAACIERDDLQAIAARCYLDLLRGGYTGVAEFLYLHRLSNAPTARLDADAAITAAANHTGISLTLLPTLYQQADFGHRPPTAAQTRFVRSNVQFLSDWHELKHRYRKNSNINLGVAFHSLRAADIEAIAEIHHALQGDSACATFHIHVAEQPAEVEACLQHHRLRPVELLADRGLLNHRWSLIHATHTTREELDLILAAQSTLVLCPTTEADLGDGCIDAAYFLDAGGPLAIGSDSNIGVHALGEFRQLEWSLRLAQGKRNVLASAAEPAVADRLYKAALTAGWQALGKAEPATAKRMRGDFVTYAGDAGDWEQHPPENYLSALVFNSQPPPAHHVMVGGKWVIHNGAHRHETEIDERYRAALQRLRPFLQHALDQLPGNSDVE